MAGKLWAEIATLKLTGARWFLCDRDHIPPWAGCSPSWFSGRAVSRRGDAARRRQRGLRPGDELVRLVEQPLRRAPEREIDRAALLFVAERRKGLGLFELRPVQLVDPEIKRVVRHHREHHAVA